MATWTWPNGKACEVKELPIDVTGRPVYVGFDVSSKIDLTSVAFIIPYQSTDLDAQGNPVVKYVIVGRTRLFLQRTSCGSTS